MALRGSAKGLLVPIGLVLLTQVIAIPESQAQARGVTGKIVVRTAVSGDETKEAIMFTAEFAPGATTGRHYHLGDEYTLLQQGTLELWTEGKELRRVSAGEAWHNPRGVVHETRNVSDEPARTVHMFIVEKGQPLAHPKP